MNIFYLARDQRIAAREHCDRHVIKMILESAQLLCTTHRYLDGEERLVQSAKTKQRRWIHPIAEMQQSLYVSTHMNHPDAIWLRQTEDHYHWLYELMVRLNEEFMRRYNKAYPHATIQKLGDILKHAPNNIDWRGGFTEPPQCMPPQYRVAGDAVAGYRNFYIHEKSRFATWTKTPTPDWYVYGRLPLDPSLIIR